MAESRISRKSPRHDVHRSVIVKGTFGTTLQRDVAMRTLTQLLAVWQREVESSHKRNKLTVTDE
jgi:glycine cleavage system aminomethyltransferase T